jgi:hypothetical protein
LTYETVGQGFRATNDGVDAQGNPTKGVFGVYFYDGKSYPVTGVPDYDANSYKVVNESTVDMTYQGRESRPDSNARNLCRRQDLDLHGHGHQRKRAADQQHCRL